jgi:hypothetical protein
MNVSYVFGSSAPLMNPDDHVRPTPLAYPGVASDSPRARSRGSPVRPNICRFSTLRREMCPSRVQCSTPGSVRPLSPAHPAAGPHGSPATPRCRWRGHVPSGLPASLPPLPGQREELPRQALRQPDPRGPPLQPLPQRPSSAGSLSRRLNGHQATDHAAGQGVEAGTAPAWRVLPTYFHTPGTARAPKRRRL